MPAGRTLRLDSHDDRVPESVWELYEDILDRGFNLRPDPEELELMRSQYRFYSKDDSDKTIFKPDSETLTEALSQKDRELVAQICQEGISRLNSSPQNLFPAG